MFFGNIVIIMSFWLSRNIPSLFSGWGNALIAWGRLSGLMAVYFVLLQFLMMGRSRWIERAFGLDGVSRIHRTNGKWSIVLILFHPVLITVGYALNAKRPLLTQFLELISGNDDLLQAFIAVILFAFVVFLSLYIVRKRLKYEFWYYVHLLTYLAILLAWGHQLELGEDFLANRLFVLYWYALYIFTFVNVFVFRFSLPVYRFIVHRFYVSDVVRETDEVTSIYISGNHMERFAIRPGQFMILRFLHPSFFLEAHPFSLSMVPSDGRLRVSIKNVGDFTQKVRSMKKGVRVLVDGPYGIFTSQLMHQNKALFIAGGIGITPIRSLVEEFASRKKNIVLLYSNKTLKQTAFKKEFDRLSRKHRFPIYYVMSQDPTYRGEKGRIDSGKLARLVPDILNREIYVCGPQPMIDSTYIALKALGVNPSRIHYEKFSLA